MRDRRARGPALRTLRCRARLTHGELAARVGCTAGHLKNIEYGFDQPSDLLAEKITHALNIRLKTGVTVDDFSDEDAA